MLCVFQTIYRPISLCNVAYEIISKLLAKRLKPLLQKCISESQGVFGLDSQIIGNIIIVHESIGCLQSSKKSAWAPLKLDMSKTDDPINRNYLRKVFLALEFCSQ